MSAPPAPPFEPVLSGTLEDLRTPGVAVEVGEEELDALGAFAEVALGDPDAWDANADIGEV